MEHKPPLRFDQIIANRFKSDLTGLPLTTCSVCGKEVLPAEPYIIAKAYEYGRCGLESLHCLTCQQESRWHASEQSKENIMLYSGRRFNNFMEDPQARDIYFLQEPSCLLTGEIISPRDAFELYSFHLPGLPIQNENYLLVGPTAMEQMAELLSEETRKSWGRYIEGLSPAPPEIKLSPLLV